MNQPNTVDFDKADGMTATQDVSLTAKQLEGEIVPLKFVKFQNVQNIQFFFKVRKYEIKVYMYLAHNHI